MNPDIRKAAVRLAPLVRGLFLNEYAVPVVVSFTEPEADDGITPHLVLNVPEWVFHDIEFEEKRAAQLLAEQFAAGKHMIGNSGATASLVLEGETTSMRFRVWFPSAVASPLPSDVTASGTSHPANPNAAAGRDKVVTGKIAIVTGGAQGFGEEIVRGLAASGAYVFIADMNIDGATKLAYAINAEQSGYRSPGAPGPAFPLYVNVADEASVATMFEAVAELTGGLDLIVSNAGVLKAGSVLEQDEKSFRFVTDVNYLGFFFIVKHGGLVLRKQHRTAPRWMTDIIQINSKSGLEGSNKNGAYAGSKFGGIGLVQSFALELIEYAIKVNAICPGNFFDGPLWSDPKNGLFVQYLNSGKVPGATSVADVRAFYEAKVPMKRGTIGRDVMRALYYLVEQEYETGQALPVTGGQVMLK